MSEVETCDAHHNNGWISINNLNYVVTFVSTVSSAFIFLLVNLLHHRKNMKISKLKLHLCLIVTLMLYCDKSRPIWFLNSFNDFPHMSLNPDDFLTNSI